MNEQYLEFEWEAVDIIKEKDYVLMSSYRMDQLFVVKMAGA